MWKMARFSIESFSMMIYKEIKFEIFLNWRIWVFQWLGEEKMFFLSMNRIRMNQTAKPNSQAMNVKKNDNFIQIQKFFFSFLVFIMIFFMDNVHREREWERMGIMNIESRKNFVWKKKKYTESNSYLLPAYLNL